MPRRSPTRLAVALTIALAAPAPADEPGEDPKALAETLTAAGARMFDARDARGLAATYAEDARLEVISKDKDTGALKVDASRGRAEIESYYDRLFEGGQRPHARNTVEYARKAGPSLLIIAGLFEPDTQADEPLRLPFTQVRMKRDGAWKIVQLQVVIPAAD